MATFERLCTTTYRVYVQQIDALRSLKEKRAISNVLKKFKLKISPHDNQSAQQNDLARERKTPTKSYELMFIFWKTFSSGIGCLFSSRHTRSCLFVFSVFLMNLREKKIRSW